MRRRFLPSLEVVVSESPAGRACVTQVRGVSKKAGFRCVMQTVVSRGLILPLPVLVLPGAIVGVIEGRGWMPASPRARLWVQVRKSLSTTSLSIVAHGRAAMRSKHTLLSTLFRRCGSYPAPRAVPNAPRFSPNSIGTRRRRSFIHPSDSSIETGGGNSNGFTPGLR